MRKPKETLYQVMVTDTKVGHEIPIGPKMNVYDALLPLVESTNMSILRGNISGWKDAHIVTVSDDLI